MQFFNLVNLFPLLILWQGNQSTLDLPCEHNFKGIGGLVPGGRLMLENFIQCGANLVQWFIWVLKHRKHIKNIVSLKDDLLDYRKMQKMQFVI